MKEKLKPCPFCGETEIKEFDAVRPYVLCSNCLAEVKGIESLEKAIIKWNARSQSDFDKTLNEDAFNSLEDENRKLKSQLKEKDINWEQEKLDICKSVLPTVFTELYREMKKKSPAIAYDYEKNIENWSINRAISLADELINQLKQQNDV